MIDSDTGMNSSLQFFGSESTNTWQNSNSSNNNSRDSNYNRTTNHITKNIKSWDKPYDVPAMKIHKESIEIKYKNKDAQLVEDLKCELQQKYSCKIHTTFFSPGSNYSGISFRTSKEEDLNIIIEEFKIKFSTIKTASI